MPIHIIIIPFQDHFVNRLFTFFCNFSSKKNRFCRKKDTKYQLFPKNPHASHVRAAALPPHAEIREQSFSRAPLFLPLFLLFFIMIIILILDVARFAQDRRKGDTRKLDDCAVQILNIYPNSVLSCEQKKTTNGRPYR